MLRHDVNSKCDDWDLHLPLAEFAHNNATSSATGETPFFICYGQHPRTPLSSAVDLEHELRDKHPSVSAFVQERVGIVRHAQAAMESAGQRMKAQTDSKRKALTFKVGDLVSLCTKHLGVYTLPSKKKAVPKVAGPLHRSEGGQRCCLHA